MSSGRSIATSCDKSLSASIPSMSTMPDGTTSTSPATNARNDFGHAGFDLEPNDDAAPAPFERALIEANEILRFFLNLNVAVANDAKGPLPQHFMARKQEPDERNNQPVKHYEARGASKRAIGQPDEPFDASGNAHQRAHRLALMRIKEFKRQSESQIGDEGKRMRGINRKRRQNREDVREEVVLQPLSFSAGQIADLEDDDAVGGEFRL